MFNKAPKLLIIDIINAINSIQEYTQGMTEESFRLDNKTKDAVLRNISIIGEAAKQMPVELKTNNPQVEWQKIIRSRNIVIHEYGGVDFEIVWKIITLHLPDLKDSLARILTNLESN
jgi:uncharacterized protein with HEPN domain